MPSSLFALAGALFYGFGDFFGGLSAKRTPVWWVAAGSQVLGLPVLVVGLVVIPAAEVTGSDLVWGAVGGVAGVFGVALLYQSLAEGTMSLVAPTTGVVAAGIPVLVGLALGEVLDPRQWIGVAVGMVAILLLAGRGGGSLSLRLAIRAVGAGTGFALMFVALAQTTEASGVWPLVGARAASIPIAVFIAVRSGRPGASRSAWGLVALAGLLDQSANLAVVVALQRGPLGVNSVLASLYPAITAIAAIAFLGERPGRFEAVGIVAAVAAALLLA